MSYNNGGPDRAARDYMYGYGATSHPQLGRQDEKPGGLGHAAGEAASYFNLPQENDSKTLYEENPMANANVDKPAANNDYDARSGYGDPIASSAYGRNDRRHHEGDMERGIADFFYKKPDPSYSGTYGTDYEPQLSKTKVVAATATVALAMFGLSQYRRNKDKQKRYERYAQEEHGRHGRHGSHRSHKSRRSGSSYMAHDDPYEGHSRY
ncbi:hypothetical protein GGF46_000677 [Coemansia sp. RSA 552]|nr:hypothetical protein GGF46_000677 [Coemansia sp. RSA 552]